VISGGVLVSGEGVAHQDRIGAIVIKFAVSLEGQLELFELAPTIERQRLVKMERLRRDQAD
jgi:hypothetical protein